MYCALQKQGSLCSASPKISALPGVHQSFTTVAEQFNAEQKRFFWNDCAWVGCVYGRGPLGGMDVASNNGKGTNGSVAPQATLDVMQALQKAAAMHQRLKKAPPAFIDVGIAEGRAGLYWASLVAAIYGISSESSGINVFGIELPHLSDYKLMHSIVEKHAEAKLGCPVNFRVVWKDCLDIIALHCEPELSFLTKTASVLYCFWTAWLPQDKEALLALVSEQPNILAVAFYTKRTDKNSSDQPFNVDYILQQLCKLGSYGTWVVFEEIEGCRFIGDGHERANAVIFRRQITCIDGEMTGPVNVNSEKDVCIKGISASVHRAGFSALDKDGWVEMCLLCGGGGGG